MEATPLSAADVAAVTNRNNCGYGYGMGTDLVWIIVLFAIFGFGGNGFGRNGNAVTQLELQQGFDNQSVMRKLDGISNGLCDGFYAQNTTMLQGFNSLGAQIAENRFAAQNCCCEIKNTIHQEAEATRALIVNNEMTALRDKLADRDRDLQTANFQLSQQAQSANIINTLRPTPIPAYPTCSPYQAANYFNGCGCAV